MVFGVQAVVIGVQNNEVVRTLLSKLAAAGIDTTLAGDTEDTGEEPPYQWRLTTRQYKPPADVVMPPQMPAFWVTVAVSWRDRPTGPPRTIELQTLKIGGLP